jgi:hypothetical protein
LIAFYKFDGTKILMQILRIVCVWVGCALPRGEFGGCVSVANPIAQLAGPLEHHRPGDACQVAFAIGNGETAKGVVRVHQSLQQVCLKIESQTRLQQTKICKKSVNLVFVCKNIT